MSFVLLLSFSGVKLRLAERDTLTQNIDKTYHQ